MTVSLDIGFSSGASSRLWRGLPRARAIAREAIAAAVAESGWTSRLDQIAFAPNRDRHCDPRIEVRGEAIQELPGALRPPGSPRAPGPRPERPRDDDPTRTQRVLDRPEGRPFIQTLFGVEVSLCLADDAALRALNSRWRGIDKATNVLSFPSAQRGRLRDTQALGDIALAFETLERESAQLAIPLADHYRHLVAHGFLHLIGYDHETDGEAERMEALETRILARLGAADPYARLKVGG